MDGKKLLLFGILVIAAGAAFLYFDPLELDLLGLKQKPAVAKPVAAAHASTPVAKPPVIVHKAAVAPRQTKASVSVPSPAPAASPAPKAVAVPIQEKKPEVATPPKTTAAAPAVVPHVAAAQSPQPAMKLSEKTKTKPTSKPERPRNLDLRHCLDLEDDAAIAKCAGE